MSDSEDELVTYGTPLEPLEEDEIPNKKPCLLEDQMVRDKQGRRRFHGAFTGGFSAGFFNTVGSLEGWTPTSFKSSKSKKQEIVQQKPEDFMDEEDISEFGIAPLVLKARQDYITENKIGSPTFPELLPLGTYVLQDVLKHVRETVGIKLLKKMGWKPGQGVGPRLNENEKLNSLKLRKKTYGCQLPPGAVEENENDSNSGSEWDDIQFAPSDYESFLCEAKNNFCGLGYEGLDKRPVLSGNSYVTEEENIIKKNKKLAFGSQAFGVGAFEEEDEDIYAKDDLSSYNFFLGKDESTDINKSACNNSFKSDEVLEGFTSGKKTRHKKNYPLPQIPKDIKPHHRIRRSRFDQSSPRDTEKAVQGVRGNFESRRELLGQLREELLLDKQREEDMTKKLISNVQISESKFKPFSASPEKQERYENYLKLIKIGKKELLSELQPLTMTNWDKEREKIEFEKAALLFRPFTGEMEDRFSTASQPDDLSDPLAVVQKYFEESDDRSKAAKMKMFGPITRRTEDWTPNVLLCKRFNIPQPQDRHSQSSDKQKAKTNFNLFDSVPNLKEKMEEVGKAELPTCQKSKEEESNMAEANDRSITDLYKAIFLVSDDEEKSCEEVSESEILRKHQNLYRSSQSKETVQDETSYEDKLMNFKRNSSPPKGIFENLDLELLSGRERKGLSAPKDSNKSDVIEFKSTTETNTLPYYGPQIPEKITAKCGFLTGEILQDFGVWVEKKSHSSKKDKKKEKKQKKVPHKSKHKHKHKR